LTDEKRTRGRPRIYETNAERKKAYRDRKRAERLAMEQRLQELEGAKKDQFAQDSILSLTYSAIKQLDTDSLLKQFKNLDSSLKSTLTLMSPLEIILGALKEYQVKLDIHSDDLIALDVHDNLLKNEELLYKIVIRNVLEVELLKRENKKNDEYELELLDNQIRQLEKEITQMKEEKVTKKILR